MSKWSVLVNLAGSAARVAARRVTGRRLRPGWSFGFETFADALKRTERLIRQLPPSAQGEAWEKRALPNPVLKQVRFERASSGEWVFPKTDPDGGAAIFFLHGGWYSSASPRNYHELLARLVVATGIPAFALDYRLAPEHPFPAAIDDAVAAWRAFGDRASPARTVVVGDSAGGGLALALLLSLRDAGQPLPAAAAVISPWVDLSASGGSLVENAAFDWSDPDEVARRVRLYLGDRDPRMPLASPVFADLRGLPPLLVQVGGAEMLLDQGRMLAERARAAGVDVTLEVAPDMIHDWHLFAALFGQSRAAIQALADFVRARLAAQFPLPRASSIVPA